MSAGWARLRSVLPARAELAAMGRRPRRDLLAGLTVAIVVVAAGARVRHLLRSRR
jgi:sulfate permease, SulP family